MKRNQQTYHFSLVLALAQKFPGFAYVELRKINKFNLVILNNVNESKYQNAVHLNY